MIVLIAAILIPCLTAAFLLYCCCIVSGRCSRGEERLEENENFIHNKYGYCYYSIESNDTAMIFNLYVEPEYRKKGHAKRLLRMVIEEIRETGFNKEIQIEARPREDSIDVENLVAFYKRMGLKVLELNS